MKPTLYVRSNQTCLNQARLGQTSSEQARLGQPSLNQASLGHSSFEHTHSTQASQIKHLLSQNAPALIMITLLVACVMTAPTFGVTVDALKAPVTELKRDIFGGWMWVAKIGAAVGGCVMAVYQRDIVPLATGAAVGMGIHFYDSYFEDVSGAMI